MKLAADETCLLGLPAPPAMAANGTATTSSTMSQAALKGKANKLKLVNTPQKMENHFKNWPNAAGFDATSEQRTPRELNVSGTFPSYVAGSLYRTGPGFYKLTAENESEADFTCSHWFDGFTTMHKFDVLPQPDGTTRVMYTSRRQVDELVESARRTGKLDGITFGQQRDPCDTFYKKVKTVFAPIIPGGPSRMNVGVDIRSTMPAEKLNTAKTPVNRILSATTDNHATKQFDADTLEPLGISRQKHLHPSLNGPISGAHCQKDPVTGDIFNYNLELAAKATYRVFRSSSSTGETTILAEVSGLDIHGAYIHSLFLTDNFVILCIWPAFFTGRGASILWERNLMDAMAKFDPSSKATWLVVDRRKGRGLVKKFTSPAFFCFHTVNAWEEKTDNEDVVDVMCELVQFDNLDILHRFYYENLVSDGSGVSAYAGKLRHSLAAHLRLYRLPSVPTSPHPKQSGPKTNQAKLIRDISSPLAGDLPRINPSYALKPHRYVWSLLDRGKSSFIDGIGKTDTQTQQCTVWEREKHTPGEPIFVPDPKGKGEDEGVLLTVVLDGERGTSYLLCLDAGSMMEVGRAEVEAAVGLGFHGLFVKEGV